MEKMACKEISIHFEDKKSISPGFYYDDKTRRISEDENVELMKTETISYIRITVKDKNMVEYLKTKGMYCGNKWIADYIKEKPCYPVVIDGIKIKEKKGTKIPEDCNRSRVLSVLYTYSSTLLLCLSKEIMAKELKTLESILSNKANKCDFGIFPDSILNEFRCGYIYHRFLEPGKRFEKFTSGINSFCSLLHDQSVSTLPITAMVTCPSTKVVNEYSLRSRQSVSKCVKSDAGSDLKTDVELTAKMAGGNSDKSKLALVHSEGTKLTNTRGDTITRNVGVNREIDNVSGSFGRGRGTRLGRGTCIKTKEEAESRVGAKRSTDLTAYPQNQKIQRSNVFDNKLDKCAVSLNSMDTHAQEGIEKERVDNIRGKNIQKCIPLQDQLKDKTTENTGLVQTTVIKSTYSATYNVNLNTLNKPDVIEANKFGEQIRLPQKETSPCSEGQPRIEASPVLKIDQNKVCSSLLDDKISHEYNSFAQCNISGLDKDHGVNQEKSPQGNALSNTKDTKEKVGKCFLDKHNTESQNLVKTKFDTKFNHKGEKKEQIENQRSQTAKKNSVSNNKGKIDTKKFDDGKSRSSVNNECQKTDLESLYCDTQQSETAKKERNIAKEVQKVIDSTSKSVSENSNNAKKGMESENNMHKEETKKNNSQSRKKLCNGLGFNEDADGKSYLKIGNQDICNDKKNVKCGEKQFEMNSTFLEATEKFADELGFQRKYYGLVGNKSVEKVILLLGASGSGKTTLVNLAANYFKDKKSADEELYHVVPSSPTSEITAYTFCSAVDEISITVIDTPGLNDSSGAEVRDHVQALKTFLANTSNSKFQIHAIGFVAQAHLVRLTSSERLVMDYVSTLFGRKVKDHLITLVTFADTQNSPPVIEAMVNYGVAFNQAFKFNNSALHSDKVNKVDDIDRAYWRVCWRNWKKCLKVLRDLQPLSVSTMKAVQSEVFSSTVLKSVERDLTASLKTLFQYSYVDRVTSKEVNKVTAEIWNLAAVLHHFRIVHTGIQNSCEDIVTEFGLEICKVQKISAEENLFFLSLTPEGPLTISGTEIIRNMAPIYEQSKSWHRKSDTISKNASLFAYCLKCEKEHTMSRVESQNWFMKKLTGAPENVLALQCNECKCPGGMHGKSLIKSPFHPEIILNKTRNALQKSINRYAIPEFPVPLFWYLKFLNHLFQYKKDEFIKAICASMNKC